MQVILKSDVRGLGRRGDIVNVKPGYYRNFLSPKGLVSPATPSLLKVALERKEKAESEKQKIVENAKEVVEKLKGLKVAVKAKATKTGKLYASVDKHDILSAIEKESGILLDKSFVETKALKEVGEHVLQVNLGEDFVQDIVVAVEAL